MTRNRGEEWSLSSKEERNKDDDDDDGTKIKTEQKRMMMRKDVYMAKDKVQRCKDKCGEIINIKKDG